MAAFGMWFCDSQLLIINLCFICVAAKIRAHELRPKSKAELLTQVRSQSVANSIADSVQAIESEAINRANLRIIYLGT